MRKPRLAEFKRIAIMQTAFVGDVALTLYLAQSIRNVAPKAEIFFIATPEGAPLASMCKAVDVTMVFDKRGSHKGIRGLITFAHAVRQSAVECILAPHRSLRTAITAHLAKTKFAVAFDRNAGSLLFDARVKYPYHIHEAERNLWLMQPFTDITYDKLKQVSPPVMEIPSPLIAEVEGLLSSVAIERNNRFIAIAPGSAWSTKRWPAEYFVEVVRLLRLQNIQAVLTGSPADIALCDEISAKTGIASFAGQTTLLQTLALFQRAQLILCNDSAPTHFANLAQTPAAVIFGPTSPIFGFGPRNEGDIVIEQKHLDCRPCSIHGGRSCPLGTHECMRTLKPDMVFARILEMFTKNNDV